MWGNTFPEGRWREFQSPDSKDVALVSSCTSSPGTPGVSPAHTLCDTCCTQFWEELRLAQGHGAISPAAPGVSQLVSPGAAVSCPWHSHSQSEGWYDQSWFNAEYQPAHKQNWGCGESSCPMS